MYKSVLRSEVVQLVVNMARLRFELIAFGIATVLLFAHGQMMMVSPPMILSHTNEPRHMGHILQPLQITEADAYSNPKESLDIERVHQRIKELEVSKHALRQKQVDLDGNIAILYDEIDRCRKQIEEDQQEIRKLEELERLHYMEQIRLERLIEQHRLAEYREKLSLKMVAQQQAIDEMNHNEERLRKASKKAVFVKDDENPTNRTYEARMSGEMNNRRLGERLSNEPSQDTAETRGLPETAHKNEQPHSTGHLRPKPSMAQETLVDLQSEMVPRSEHAIEKKEVIGSEPKKIVVMCRDNLKVVNEPKRAPLIVITGLNKTELIGSLE